MIGVRDITFLWLFLFVANMSNAADVTRCEGLYQSVMDSKRFPNSESKIKYLRDNGRSCEGTGIYESRLAYFYVDAKRFSDAEKTIRDGLSKPNPYHKQLKYSLVDIDVLQGRLDVAFSKAIRLQQEHEDWYGGYLLLSKITLMQRRFEESIQYAIESNKRSPEAGAYLGMTIAYHQLGKDEQAVESIYMAIKLDVSVVSKAPGMDEAIYSLVRLTRYQEAATLAETRIKNDGDWTKDKTFVKAVNYLKTKGFLGEGK